MTVDSVLKTAKEAASLKSGDDDGQQKSKDVAKTLRASYQKTVAKNKDLRLDAPASTVQEAKVSGY